MRKYGLTECCIGNLGYLFLKLLQGNSSSAELFYSGDKLGLHECVIPSFIDQIEETLNENSIDGNTELKILHDEIVNELQEGSYFNIRHIDHYFARIDYELEGRDIVAEFFKKCFKEASESANYFTEPTIAAAQKMCDNPDFRVGLVSADDVLKPYVEKKDILD